eukprot:6298831-Prymnesium_polylepis.1
MAFAVGYSADTKLYTVWDPDTGEGEPSFFEIPPKHLARYPQRRQVKSDRSGRGARAQTPRAQRHERGVPQMPPRHERPPCTVSHRAPPPPPSLRTPSAPPPTSELAPSTLRPSRPPPPLCGSTSRVSRCSHAQRTATEGGRLPSTPPRFAAPSTTIPSRSASLPTKTTS